MSSGEKVPWKEAYHLASEVAAHLAPWVQRSKCVGSVRRRRATCSDIEFVVEPHMAADLLGAETPLTEPIRVALEEIGTWKQGGDRHMAITDVLGQPGLRLEVYLLHPPSTWGSMVAVRTGPAELNKRVMHVLRERGYRHVDHHVKRGAEVVPTDTEKEFFALAGIPCVPPAKRDALIEGIRAGHHIRRVG